MKRHAALAVLALALPLAACNDDTGSGAAPDPVTIEVESRDWNGWDRNHKPTPKVERIEAEEGTTFEVQGLSEPITIEVIEIGEDAIEIESSEALSPEGETGGINLSGATQSHTLERDEPLRLSTPSMDMGMNYEFKVA